MNLDSMMEVWIEDRGRMETEKMLIEKVMKRMLETMRATNDWVFGHKKGQGYEQE